MWIQCESDEKKVTVRVGRRLGGGGSDTRDLSSCLSPMVMYTPDWKWRSPADNWGCSQNIPAYAKLQNNLHNISCPHMEPCMFFIFLYVQWSWLVTGKRSKVLKADSGQFPTDRGADLPHGVRKGPCTKTVSHLYVNIRFIQTVQIEICVPEMVSHLQGYTSTERSWNLV